MVVIWGAVFMRGQSREIKRAKKKRERVGREEAEIGQAAVCGRCFGQVVKVLSTAQGCASHTLVQD